MITAGPTFDIPPQGLDTALLAFSQQSRIQVLSATAALSKKTSAGVRGSLVPDEALRRLLLGSGLSYLRPDSGTVVIVVIEYKGPERRDTEDAARRPDPDAERHAQVPLEEVVVTATRRPDVLNRVPLSISAKTQRMLDQQGIRTLGDLMGPIPAMAVSQTQPGVAFVSIRGIQNNGAGASTTGFYLDDTPLTKRGALGCCTANGTPLPALFDLERIEVLRGPQGTLFGSGSQGGAIRFITPQPGFSEVTLAVRAEVSQMWDGELSHEAGVVLGTPIVRDRLGVRLTYFERRSGGWLDYRNRQNNALEHRNANDDRLRLFRGIAAWRPVDDARITVSWFSSNDAAASRTNAYTRSTQGPILEPEACYDAAGRLLPSCAGSDVSYRRPALTLPALPDLGRHTTVDPAPAPSDTRMDVGALTLDYKLGSVHLRSITSYVEDVSRITQPGGGSQNRIRATSQNYEGFSFDAMSFYAGLADLPQAYTYGTMSVENRRYGFTQELRATSGNPAQRLGWVAGAYYANHRTTQAYDLYYPDFDLLVRSLTGISALQRYGVPMFMYHGQPIGWSAKYQTIKDTEFAAFGEANYRFTERLTGIVGVRVSRLGVRYFEVHYGPASGGNDPAKVPGGITGPENHTESAVAPKVSVQYQFTDNDMAYATVSKGFRAGGVNASIPETLCGATLARYGETVLTVPKTYKSDTVWSYEAGA
ncbi:MAG TPA: TonB-dependent receptor, partial [Phenylobacterium sp.]|uniref:TonB-dependent receptor n=1 Tax=Phenylobacterium sp. TaxID=1871053 RepID=UPI002B49CC6B